MRISDWSSDVCSSDLRRTTNAGLRALSSRATFPGISEKRGNREQIRPKSCPLHTNTCASVARTAQVVAMPLATLLADPAAWAALITLKIGRASRRERVCQYG